MLAKEITPGALIRARQDHPQCHVEGSHTLAWTSVQGQGVQTVQTVLGQIGRLRGGFSG
jgi:hypothetical protein